MSHIQTRINTMRARLAEINPLCITARDADPSQRTDMQIRLLQEQTILQRELSSLNAFSSADYDERQIAEFNRKDAENRARALDASRFSQARAALMQSGRDVTQVWPRNTQQFYVGDSSKIYTRDQVIGLARDLGLLGQQDA